MEVLSDRQYERKILVFTSSVLNAPAVLRFETTVGGVIKPPLGPISVQTLSISSRPPPSSSHETIALPFLAISIDRDSGPKLLTLYWLVPLTNPVEVSGISPLLSGAVGTAPRADHAQAAIKTVAGIKRCFIGDVDFFEVYFLLCQTPRNLDPP